LGINELLESALTYRRSGELCGAAEVFRQIVALVPNESIALHLLTLRVHEYAIAAEYVGRALLLDPGRAPASASTIAPYAFWFLAL
jgi:hypothetical protein